MSTATKTRFPSESAEYRAAREALLGEEAELRRRIERVADLRRKLPLGGAVVEDYAFQEGATDLDDTATTRAVRLSELFVPEKTAFCSTASCTGRRWNGRAPCARRCSTR